MNAARLLRGVDRVAAWSGPPFAWLFAALTLAVGVEVVTACILPAPAAPASGGAPHVVYAALLAMCGPYTLALTRELRADLVYRRLRPRVQAAADLVLYAVASLPALAALCAWPAAPGRPLLLELVVPLAGALVTLQGAAEIVRCIVGLRTGRWSSGTF